MKKWKIIVPIVIATNIVALFGIIAALPTINLHISDGHIVRNNINDYHTALSSVSLCRYLNVRDESKKTKDEYFVNKYQCIDAKSYFRFEGTYNGGYEHETVIMCLTYDALLFNNILDDIKKQPGFSEEINFVYKNITFYLNQTDKITDGAYAYTNYDISSTKSPYLHWINLVGFLEDNNCIIFIGFYHLKQWRSGFWKYDEEYYPFEGWDEFFKKEFSYL